MLGFMAKNVVSLLLSRGAADDQARRLPLNCGLSPSHDTRWMPSYNHMFADMLQSVVAQSCIQMQKSLFICFNKRLFACFSENQIQMTLFNNLVSEDEHI